MFLIKIMEGAGIMNLRAISRNTDRFLNSVTEKALDGYVLMQAMVSGQRVQAHVLTPRILFPGIRLDSSSKKTNSPCCNSDCKGCGEP